MSPPFLDPLCCVAILTPPSLELRVCGSEKPFYITGVAHPDGDNMDSGSGAPVFDPQEETFGKLLQSAYDV
jgi:hypothetical protein